MDQIVERDHESQRAAWACGWFASLMKARRVGGDVERPVAGLNSLGIQVVFEEDEIPALSNTEQAGPACAQEKVG